MKSKFERMIIIILSMIFIAVPITLILFSIQGLYIMNQMKESLFKEIIWLIFLVFDIYFPILILHHLKIIDLRRLKK